jgi:hypothetical protein
MIERLDHARANAAASVKTFTFGVVFELAACQDLADLATVVRGAPRKMAPPIHGAESREETPGLCSGKRGSCEEVVSAARPPLGVASATRRPAALGHGSRLASSGDAARQSQLPISATPPVSARLSIRRPHFATVADMAAYVTAGVAGVFSIRGMVVLFPGAPLTIVTMAIAMESAKLVTAGWLAARWSVTAGIWRGVLVALVSGLAVINAAGVFSQLVAAHVGERGAAQAAVETQDAALAARIELSAGKVADLDHRLAQIDTAVEVAAKRGRTNTALSAMEDSARPVRRSPVSATMLRLLGPT